ncbi:nicotinamide riboside transporter PnuC [Fructilactobacillus sp. Tb1]|uniref:nicotinamide riboside transporter PnuC n=1 Tax=Fructilactobacillus sp. Tb1 TaxID=3422304 RepID=UPI003D2A87C9
MNALSKTFSIKNNLRDIKEFKFKTKILLISSLIITFVTFVISKEFSNWIGWVSLVASVFSLINLMLCDEGKITNYGWGLAESTLFLLIDLENRLIGDFATNIYYLITQFMGIFLWDKQIEQQKQQAVIKPRKLTKLQIGLIVIGILMIYGIVLYFSKTFHGTQIYLDATLLPLSIIGMLLMMGGYRSQWLVWIAWDVVSLIIWYNQFKAFSPASASMFALEIMKLANGCYGAYMWFVENEKVAK